jgi:hypothetical protein
MILAVAGLMLTACGGDDVADIVEVTGTSTGVQIQDGTMSGPALPTTGWEATTLRDSVYVYTNVMSDARVSGEQETTVNCDFVEDGEAVIGDCWGTLTIENDGGTWDGTFTGTTTWSLSEPDHVHVIDPTFVGTGDYDGLRYVMVAEGTDYPWAVTGRIEPAE